MNRVLWNVPEDETCTFLCKKRNFPLFLFFATSSMQKMPPDQQEATQEILYRGVRDPMFYSTRKHMFLLLIKSDMIRHFFDPFYRHWYEKKAVDLIDLCLFYGAGDGNRTHATSLEGWGSTIELHPHMEMVGAEDRT